MSNYFFSHQLSQALVESILHSFWQGAIIILVLFFVNRSENLLRTREKYFVNISGLICLFIGFIFSFIFSYFSQYTATGNIGFESFTGIAPLSDSETLTSGMSWQNIVWVSWLFGVFFLGLRSVLGLSKIGRLNREAEIAGTTFETKLKELTELCLINRKVILKFSYKITSPLVFGILKPSVLLPVSYLAQMSPEQLETIMLHELQHIKENDFLINLIQICIESILYFNPATWWISAQIRKYREFNCDDAVMQLVNGSPVYAEALYQAAIFRHQNLRHSTALFNHKSQLIMRIQRLLSTGSQETLTASWIRIPIILLMGISFLSFNYLEHQKSESSEYSIDLQMAKAVPDLAYSLPSLKNTKLKQRRPLESLYKIRAEENEVKLNIKVVPEIVNLDSIPEESDPRIEELSKKLEGKSKELEILSAKLEKEIHSKIEIDVEKLEALSRELEEKMKPLTEKLEKEIEANLQVDVEKLEKLEKEISRRVEEKMKAFELIMESKEMKELEKKMQELGRKMEKEMQESEGDINSPRMKELQGQMNEIQHKFQANVQEANKIHSELMNDEELKKLKMALRDVHASMQDAHIAHNELWTDEMKALQEEMSQIQLKINRNMSDLNESAYTQINELAREVELLSRELMEEQMKTAGKQ